MEYINNQEYPCKYCGEVTYPDAYNTVDEDKNHRICNGCGKDYELEDLEKDGNNL